MASTMEALLAALADQHAELDALLEDPDWQAPTRCEGWTVADVVLHLAQTDEMAAASLENRFEALLAGFAGEPSPRSIDEGVALMVERERDVPGHDVRARWRSASGDVRRLLSSCDPHRRVHWVAGELSAMTLAATRLSECWIHTGDVAGALARPVQVDDRLWYVARLAWRTLPYAFARAGRDLSGPVAFELRAPSGATWTFTPDEAPSTTIRGDGEALCMVAGRRLAPHDADLRGEGPDADAVLELVRTYA